MRPANGTEAARGSGFAGAVRPAQRRPGLAGGRPRRRPAAAAPDQLLYRLLGVRGPGRLLGRRRLPPFHAPLAALLRALPERPPRRRRAGPRRGASLPRQLPL